MVLAHRGASAYAPDHTLEAIGLALEQGADAIEVDVHLTRDGCPVLHHGGDLSENTEASGPVGRYSLSELRRFDAGYQFTPDAGASFPHRGRGHSVVTLAEALDTFPNVRFNLDIKERRAALATRRVIDDFDAGDRVLLAAFYSWQRGPALSGYRGPRSTTLDQMLPYMLLHWAHLDALWPMPVDALQLPELHWGVRVVTPRLIERAHRRGLHVHVWTVDEQQDMERLLDWGVDGIITKRPDVAVETRARRQSP